MIEGLPDGRFAIYTKIHHALLDGVTGAKMTAKGLGRHPTEEKLPLWAQTFSHPTNATPKAEALGLLQQISCVARAGADILPGIGSGLWDIVRATYAQGTTTLPFQAPPSPFNVEISGSRHFAAQSHSLARLKQIGAVAGATVIDVTLAICAGALREYLMEQGKLPRKPLVAMVPVSLHGKTAAGGK
ncbi:MAG: hypothetical protein K9K38_15430 [Rhodoferax sp.]|nr:hypothetical protein [Rhodoferax sp.]